MPSYLKFDGQDDVARGLAGGYASSTGSVVLTMFARFLQVPTYTAPLFTISDPTHCYAGIWLYGQPVRPTYGVLAAQVRVVNPVSIDYPFSGVFADASDNPFRVGRIYKIQFLATYTGGSGIEVALAVDGARLATGNLFSTQFGQPGGSFVYRIGGQGEGSGDRLGGSGGITSIRGAHMEVFQAMAEFDRTLSLDGGGHIDTSEIGSDTDPFDDDLELAGDADSSSSRWLMNDGSGTTVSDEEGNADLSISSFPPSWAGSPDPVISGATATYSFANVQGYALRHSDAPDVVPLPVSGPGGPVGDKTSGQLRLAPMARWWWDDGEQGATQFAGASNLTASSAQVWEGDESVVADSASSSTDYDALDTITGSGTKKIWVRCRFYDPAGTTSTRLQRFLLKPFSGISISIGVHISESASNYIAFVNGASTEHVDTGVAISEGWHEFLIYLELPSTGNGIARFYIEAAEVREETGTAIGGCDYIGIRSNGVSASDDQAYYDQMELGFSYGASNADYAGLVEPLGSHVLPLCQPSQGVRYFKGVTITDEEAGGDTESTGTTAYTFRHSTDGGSSWSSSATLNDANLQALACAGNGQDVLEITPALTADLDDMASPNVQSIVIDFEPAIDVVSLDEESRETDGLALEAVA